MFEKVLNWIFGPDKCGEYRNHCMHESGSYVKFIDNGDCRIPREVHRTIHYCCRCRHKQDRNMWGDLDA